MSSTIRSVAVCALVVSLASSSWAGSREAALLETPGRVSVALQQYVVQQTPSLSIHFSGFHDTRCPADVPCAWAGEARAFFWISGAGIRPQVLTLPWDGGHQPAKHTQKVGPFRFYLVSLEPRPLHHGDVNPLDYTAVLDVSTVGEPVPVER